MSARDVHYIRSVVSWANDQREDFLDCAADGPLTLAGLCALFDACDYCHIEDVLSDGEPDQRRAVRRALRMRVKAGRG